MLHAENMLQKTKETFEVFVLVILQPNVHQNDQTFLRYCMFTTVVMQI